MNKIGTQTYSPTKVRRYKLAEDQWEEVEVYEDATIRDQGEGGFLRSPQAMLRAYSNDPDKFFDEDYQADNGIRVVSKTAAARDFRDPKMEGWVVDCDSDIALHRVEMCAITAIHNFGHGSLEYVGFVSDDPDGYDLSRVHIERWMQSIKDDK